MKLAARGLVGGGATSIDGGRVDKAQRAHGFDVALHGQQHAPHVGMFDDRRRRLGRPDGVALSPLVRECQCLLIRTLADGQPFDADRQSRKVHHGENVAHALLLVTDEVTDRAVMFA